MDDDGSRTLNLEEFSKGIRETGLELNEEEEKRLEEIEDSYWREFEAKGTDFLILLKGGRG